MALSMKCAVNSQKLALKGTRTSCRSRLTPVARASALSSEVPDMSKRQTMNWILLGGAALPVGTMAVPYLQFFVPNSGNEAGGSIVAKDSLGNDIYASNWVATHMPGDRSLSQGLKGDPAYLIVKDDGHLESYGLNSICTHLGCVVPWVPAEKKFMCPCHGSQYNTEGAVVRGPAPLPLALEHVNVSEEGKVVLSPWEETDFRTNSEPWWK